MSDCWYALRVKPHKERMVHELLMARDIHVFFPTIKVVPKNPRASRRRPYFPGYMFVKADLGEMGLNAFSWLPGTRGLVAFGNIPALVPENLIAELKKRVAALEKRGGIPANRLKKGEKVRIVSGPFAGYSAIFDLYLSGSERVQILLAFLSNHLQPIKTDIRYIEKMS